jgi:hypothetical protein
MAVAGMVMAVAVAPSDAAVHRKPQPTRAYDGMWSVLITTEAGPCDPSYRYPAQIVDGQIQQADNDFSYQISGAVVSSGAIAVSVSKGIGTANGYGRLHGASGFGRWTTSGNQCSGTWSAMRRGA